MKKIKSTFPYLYLEHGSLYRKDHNIVFQNKEGYNHIPLDSFLFLLIGSGVKISSNCMSHISNNDCFVCISSSKNIPKMFLTNFCSMGNSEYVIRQCELCNSKSGQINVSKRILNKRFNTENFNSCRSYNEILLKEARYTKKIYKEVFGKNFKREYKNNDKINKLLNISNNALYGYCSAIIHMIGLSPHIGFLHGTRRNAFVFDLSEYIKDYDYYKLLSYQHDNAIKDSLRNISKFIFEKKQKIILNEIKNVFSQSG